MRAATKRLSLIAAQSAAMSGNAVTCCPVGTAVYQGHGERARCYQRGAMGQAIRILGIDPGLRRTGWGLSGCEGNRLIFVACGSVETNERLSLAERLGTIHDGLTRIVDEFRPDEAAGEGNFVNREATATLKLEKAQIRLMVGVLLPKAAPQSEDAADALAIAVTHAHHRASALLKVAMR